MNSKEFIKAVEDGKTLVLKKNRRVTVYHGISGRLNLFDEENGIFIHFDLMVPENDVTVKMYKGSSPIGALGTSFWEVLE